MRRTVLLYVVYTVKRRSTRQIESTVATMEYDLAATRKLMGVKR